MPRIPIKIEMAHGKSKSKRMFGWISQTWNPVAGCRHGCSYCWARDYAERLRRMGKPRYVRYGFKPSPPTKKELEKARTFHNKLVFVTDMGDLFGDWVPKSWIEKVLQAIRNNAKGPNNSTFLLLTKNPKRFKEFSDIFPENVILGTTIETNRAEPMTHGKTGYTPQSRHERYVEMKNLDWKRKFVAIEPVMDFDLQDFCSWIEKIKPEKASLSFDNYNKGLPSPQELDVVRLVKRLSNAGIELHLHGDWVKKSKKCPKCRKKSLIAIGSPNKNGERRREEFACLNCTYEK